MIKKIGIKLAFLLGIVVLNIYPMGCSGWGGQPVEAYMIKKDEYIKALECAKNDPKTSAKDKEYLELVKNEANNRYTGMLYIGIEIVNYKTKYPTCNFNYTTTEIIKSW